MSNPSTFDGSSSGTPPEAQAWTPAASAPPAPAPAPAFDEAPDSLLDQLRDEIAQREESDVELWRYRIRGTNFRLVCDPDIDNEDYQRWVKASMPKAKGRRRMAAVTDMDQLTLSSYAIIGSNVGLEVLARGTDDTWRMVTAPGGATLAVDSPELLSKFSTPDPVALLRKLFGRDAALIDGGQDLLAKAGYLGDDDDEDPTVPVRSAAHGKKP